MNFRFQYREFLALLLNNFVVEKNARTGEEILVLPGGFYFTIGLHDGSLPLIDCRLTHPTTAAAEVAWFIQGTRSTEWLNKYTSIWKGFEEDLPDLEVKRRYFGREDLSIRGVKAAYGYRWAQHFGVDQLKTAVLELKRDPSSRRVWISTWDPASDLVANNQKNVPCPVGFSLYILQGRLFSSYMLRSSDTFMGLPYDVMNHAMLMAVLARSIGCSLGGMSITLSHAHMYAQHVDMARQCLKYKQAAFEPMENPSFFSLEDIHNHPDNYVNYVADAAKQKQDWPTLNLKPKLVL